MYDTRVKVQLCFDLLFGLRMPTLADLCVLHRRLVFMNRGVPVFCFVIWFIAPLLVKR